jgi:putative endonuclease
MRDYRFFVYILASKSRVIYVGMTNDLVLRVFQHKNGRCKGFTQRYKVNRLVYFESYRYVNSAIEREKELKGWRREKRVALIESINPLWEDLARDWFTAEELKRDPYAPVKIEFDSSRVLALSNRTKNEERDSGQ